MRHTIAIRSFRPDDAAALSAITQAAIRKLGPRHYNAAQVEAWAARHPAAERFTERAALGDMIWAACGADSRPLAYVLMEPDGHVDMLYCHPDHAGRGLAGRLLAQAEQHARMLDLMRLYSEASELARPVLARAGYALVRRRDFAIEGVMIHNYAMEKRL